MTKISQLSSIGDSLAIDDQFLIRDVSDTVTPNKSVTVSGITRGLADGDALAPAIAFAADKNTGIYRPGADQLAISTNGTQRLTVDTAATTSTLPVVHPLGAVGTPSITFTGDLNTGIYSPAADTIAFVEGGAEAMRIDSSGQVGIGSTAPATLLHLQKTAGDTDIRLSDGTHYWTAKHTTSDNALSFTYDTGERFRCDASGRLLVGTSSARSSAGVTGQFQVEGTSFNTSSISLINNVNSNQCSYLTFGKSRSGSIGGSTVVQSGDLLGYIQFAGADGTDLESVGADIAAYVDGTPGANDMPGRLVFSVTADGSASPTEALRITNDRYVRLASGSGGIQFNGDTAAANALDDYEEGTHTATLTPSTSGSITLNASYQTLAYTKVGRLVSVRGTLIASSSSSPVGYVTVSLPFVPATVSGIGYAGGSVFVDAATGVNLNQFVVMIVAGGARIYLGDSTALQSDSAEAIASAGQVYLEINYHV